MRKLEFVEGPVIIGVIHLPPTLGSPLFRNMEEIVEKASREAVIMEKGGVDGIIVENFWDIPFYPRRVPPETIASMTLAVNAAVKSSSIPVGVNVLRNDSLAALAIAKATGASFIRVNVLMWAYATDQGIVEGEAFRLLRKRRELGGGVDIFADVRVKHARPVVEQPIVDEAKDLIERGLADAIIVTGSRTGVPPDEHLLREIREKVDCKLLIGSGIKPENADLLRYADGAIVGSYFRGGDLRAPVDQEKVRRLVEIAKKMK